MKIRGWDLDGTLWTHTPDNFKFEAITPLPEVIAEFKAQMAAGDEVHIITARCRPLRELTLRQVREHLDPNFPEDRIHTKDEDDWVSEERDAEYKAEKLRLINAHWYRGDRIADMRAAEMAGCQFEFVGQLKGDWSQ
jgi:phosphoglycolate phosphatase-like HAD superfamily hydrolase